MPIIHVRLEDARRVLHRRGVPKEKMSEHVEILKQLDRQTRARLAEDRNGAGAQRQQR